MIKLVNVNKYYQSGNELIHVIKDLNYEFPNTGLVFILGPSGSGKSTLITEILCKQVFKEIYKLWLIL